MTILSYLSAAQDVTARALHRIGALTVSSTGCSPAELSMGVGLNLWRLVTVEHEGYQVELIVAGTALGRALGQPPRVAPVPQRALELASALDQALAVAPHPATILINRRRHLVASPWEDGTWIHAVRVEAPDAKTVRHLLHDVFDAHNDDDFGEATDLELGCPVWLTLYVPSGDVRRMRRDLAPSISIGHFDVRAFELDHWPSK